LGRGTTFRIELAAVTADAARDDSPDPESLPMRRGLRILLVEDNAPTVNVMADALRSKGYEVTTATSLAGGIEAASAHFEVVISDIDLGDGSGLDLMRHVKSLHGIPGIALSGYATEEDIRESRRAGFLVHLAKPVTCTKLEATIQQVASKALEFAPAPGGGGSWRGQRRETGDM
jgi:CheY-like chemotaxis protein